MIELNFLGNGSCFNTKLGCTSAYFFKDNNFYLIDCGTDVFKKLKERNILDNLKKESKIYILITHTHTDHIGSLSDMLFYCKFVLKRDIIIITSDKVAREVYHFLEITGADICYNYNDFLIRPKEANLNGFIINNEHVPEIPSCSFYFDEIFWSGDSNKESVENTINELKNEKVERYYIDCCSNPAFSHVHCSIESLKNMNPEIKSKIYCIHIDEGITKKTIEQAGLNYVMVNNNG